MICFTQNTSFQPTENSEKCWSWADPVQISCMCFDLVSKTGKRPTNKQAPCCLLITCVALFIPVIEVDFSTISVPCCTEFQEKRPRDLNNSGFSIPALCSALWQCPNCTLGVSAFGFGGSLALLTSWNCTDSITWTVQTGLYFSRCSGDCYTAINVLFSFYKWAETYYCLNLTKEKFPGTQSSGCHHWNRTHLMSKIINGRNGPTGAMTPTNKQITINLCVVLIMVGNKDWRSPFSFFNFFSTLRELSLWKPSPLQ